MDANMRLELPEWMHTALAAGWKPPYVNEFNLLDFDYGGDPVDPRWMRQEYQKRRAYELANPEVTKVAFNEKYETRAL